MAAIRWKREEPGFWTMRSRGYSATIEYYERQYEWELSFRSRFVASGREPTRERAEAAVLAVMDARSRRRADG